jgi:hypothetical protein
MTDALIPWPVGINAVREGLSKRQRRFAYADRVYPSLSAVAITGSHCNGFLFFRNTLNHTKETA